MRRRLFICAPLGLALHAQGRAHHGWSSFDQTRPLYLEGRVAGVAWRNPHVELQLDISPAHLKLPADLAARRLPAQTASVDGPALLKAAQLPTRRDKRWEIELAPLSRMQAWGVQEIRVGDGLAMLGFSFVAEEGGPVLRVEYLFVQDKVYALRSAPA